MDDNWYKQSTKEPLFNDLIWSRPENKSNSGKLLLIGGSNHGFSETVKYYSDLSRAGLGTIKVILSNSTKKILGNMSDDIIYCASNNSGSLGSEAYAEIIDYASWADGLFLSGELGSNSQTVILIEKLVTNYQKLILFYGDSVDIALQMDTSLLLKSNHVFIAPISKIQKMFTKMSSKKAITSKTSLHDLIKIFYEFSQANPISIVTILEDHVIAISDNKISTTKINDLKSSSLFNLAAHVVCWSIQNPKKLFEAFSCSAITFQ
ncbi:MAG TPA: hypothetical protein VMR76_01495 [Candidatus Saccharimonadia bacterium]|nr:hypothetical protein [Candidatus Saccharimonadia bacterium]